MTVQKFLDKYGTRAVSMLIRQSLANDVTAIEAATDLQAMLEHFIAKEERMAMSLREAIHGGEFGNAEAN
jgi:hypothetical protein